MQIKCDKCGTVHDTVSPELVRQKQQLLAQAIKDTKEKLETLKTAAAKANEQLQKGEITQEQYDALQREIQETEQQLMELAQKSLAGRTAIVHMSALSQSELYGDHWSEPLSLDLQKLNSRKEHLAACGSAEMFERIWNGGMPGHRSGRFKDRDVFYSSYIQTYINRDVTDMIPGVDKLLFADFIRAAACRVGQMPCGREKGEENAKNADFK